MANIDSVTPFTSASGLTTGKVTTFFPVTDAEASGFTLAIAELTFAAETGATVSVPLFTMSGYSAGLRILPSTIQMDCFKAFSQAGTSPTTLVTLTIGGTQATVASAITAAGGSSAVVAALAKDQHLTVIATATGSNASVLRPGNVVALLFTQGGTSPTLTGGARFRVNGTAIWG